MGSLYYVTSQSLNFGYIGIRVCMISLVIGDVKRRFKYCSWTFIAVHPILEYHKIRNNF